MSLDPTLLEILACPCEHHAPLAPRPDGATGATTALDCTRCATSFPVRDGIPVMLLDEATPGPRGVGAHGGGDFTADIGDERDPGAGDAAGQEE